MTADRRISSRVFPGRGELSVMLLITGLLGCFPHCGRAAEALPGASEVTRRMIERAQAVARPERDRNTPTKSVPCPNAWMRPGTS